MQFLFFSYLCLRIDQLNQIFWWIFLHPLLCYFDILQYYSEITRVRMDVYVIQMVSDFQT